MRLKDIISNIQYSIKNENINYGGCIHFAYYLSEELKKHNIDHKIIAVDSDEDAIENADYCAFSHVMIWISNIGYVDAQNTFKTKKQMMSKWNRRYYFNISDRIDLNEIRNIEYIWNDSYDKRYNSILSRVIKNKFKAYCK